MLGKLLQRFIAPIPPGEFTTLVEEHIESLGNGLEPRVIEPLHLQVFRAGEKQIDLHLDNLYRNYLADRGRRQELISHYIQAMVGVDLETFLPRDVIPTIKDKGYIQEVSSQLSAKGTNPEEFFVFEEYNDVLAILYAIDSPQSIRFLNPKDLAELNLQGETLREFAINNLKQILPPVEVHGSPPCLLLKAGGMFESSLLLFDRVWNKAELGIKGDILVAVPSRDTLLVGDTAEARSITQLRKTAADVARSSGYALTDKLFVRRDNKFLPFE